MVNLSEGYLSTKKGKVAVSIFIIMYGFFTLFPCIDAWFLRPVPSDRQVEPAFMSGLFTGSSILFGFSSLLTYSEKPVKRILRRMLLPPLFFIGCSGGAMGFVALGNMHAVTAVLFLAASFNCNILTSFFVMGFRSATWEKQES